MREEIQAQIEAAVKENEILLFMKGTPAAPNCGFSAATVEILDSLLGEGYASVDVLAHPEIREGIKEFSSWPTIPQLYVKGQFLGGADIISQLFESGELAEALGVSSESDQVPQLEISEAALKAFQGYLDGSDDVIILKVDRGYEASLSLGAQPEKAVIAAFENLIVAMDRLTASRANGLSIDYLETPEGPAFKVDHPNKPKGVVQMSVHELKQLMEQNEKLRLIDVRTEGEWEIAKIEGAELLTEELQAELTTLPKDTVLVMQCHHGHRSDRAAQQLVQRGFTHVYNLAGGIDAWSKEVDENVPQY